MLRAAIAPLPLSHVFHFIFITIIQVSFVSIAYVILFRIIASGPICYQAVVAVAWSEVEGAAIARHLAARQVCAAGRRRSQLAAGFEPADSTRLFFSRLSGTIYWKSANIAVASTEILECRGSRKHFAYFAMEVCDFSRHSMKISRICVNGAKVRQLYSTCVDLAN